MEPSNLCEDKLKGCGDYSLELLVYDRNGSIAEFNIKASLLAANSQVFADMLSVASGTSKSVQIYDDANDVQEFLNLMEGRK